jgi:hypothetical protein
VSLLEQHIFYEIGKYEMNCTPFNLGHRFFTALALLSCKLVLGRQWIKMLAFAKTSIFFGFALCLS